MTFDVSFLILSSTLLVVHIGVLVCGWATRAPAREITPQMDSDLHYGPADAANSLENFGKTGTLGGPLFGCEKSRDLRSPDTNKLNSDKYVVLPEEQEFKIKQQCREQSQKHCVPVSPTLVP